MAAPRHGGYFRKQGPAQASPPIAVVVTIIILVLSWASCSTSWNCPTARAAGNVLGAVVIIAALVVVGVLLDIAGMLMGGWRTRPPGEPST